MDLPPTCSQRSGGTNERTLWARAKRKGGWEHYVVTVGRRPGIYSTWEEANKQVSGFSGGRCRGFDRWSDALSYLKEASTALPPPSPSGRESDPTRVPFSAVDKRQAPHEYREPHEPTTPDDGCLHEDAPTVDQVGTADISNLEVHVHGHCGRKGEAGIGVYFGSKDPRNLSVPFPLHPPVRETVDLYALTRALEACIADAQGRDARIRVHTDSLYLINCVQRYLPIWKRNGWRRKDGSLLEHRVLLEIVAKQLEELSVSLVFVPNFRRSLFERKAVRMLALEGAKDCDRAEAVPPAPQEN